MWLFVRIPSVQKKKWFNFLKKLPRNNLDAKDDPYETLVFAYSKEME
jgi:hypothetical protein